MKANTSPEQSGDQPPSALPWAGFVYACSGEVLGQIFAQNIIDVSVIG